MTCDRKAFDAIIGDLEESSPARPSPTASPATLADAHRHASVATLPTKEASSSGRGYGDDVPAPITASVEGPAAPRVVGASDTALVVSGVEKVGVELPAAKGRKGVRKPRERRATASPSELDNLLRDLGSDARVSVFVLYVYVCVFVVVCRV